jgi:hypothetical protein
MENQQRPSDVIDLSQLFEKAANFFNNIGLGFMKFLALLRNTPLQNKTLFISLTLAGGIFGYYYSSFLKKKFFESSMIFSSDYLNKRIIDNSISKLNLLADEETPRGLAVALNIPDSLARDIVKFEAKPFVAERELVEIEVLKEQLRNAQINSKNQNVIDQVIKRIEIENQHAFEFTVRTFSPTAVKPIQDALVNYFKNNDYIKKRIQINKTNLGLKRSKLLHDSQKLDSLKKIIYSNYKNMAEQGRQGSNNVILSDKPVTNPIDIYKQDQLVYEDLMDVEKKIFLQPDFEVVDGFTEFNSPASARRSKVIITAMLIAFALGYAFVGLRWFNKYLSRIS